MHNFSVYFKSRWLRKTENYPEEIKFLKTSMKNNTRLLKK